MRTALELFTIVLFTQTAFADQGHDCKAHNIPFTALRLTFAK